MTRIVRVEVCDFSNPDQNYGRVFNKIDTQEFLNDQNTKQGFRKGWFTTCCTHDPRIVLSDEEIYQHITEDDKQLKEKNIVGIISDMFIEGNKMYADIKLLKTTEYAKLINELIDLGVELCVSISFLDCSDDENYFKIYKLQGVDFTLSPAIDTSRVIGEIKNDNR